MADPAATSVVIPAFNEAASIAAMVRDLAATARWREILVVDDGSTDGTGALASAAGARVIRHPYNKGNGAAVKSGIREATGEFILIADGDGQHRPSDAPRLVSHLDPYDLVVGARSGRTQAGLTRRLGNATLNAIATYLTQQRIPDLTSGFRAARRDHLVEFLHLLPTDSRRRPRPQYHVRRWQRPSRPRELPRRPMHTPPRRYTLRYPCIRRNPRSGCPGSTAR